MTNPWYEMQPYNLFISLVGPRTNAWFMHFLKPMSEKLPNLLLRASDEYAFLLLIECGLEFFLNLPPCFSVQKLAFPAFERDFCRPPAIFAPVNGAFTTSAFCHKGTPFSGAQLSI